MVALFRIVELSLGQIFIDGLDISKIPLRTLRSKLAIIPQDPVLFTGTIRFQLDPFEKHSDLEIWDILKLINLFDLVTSMQNSLQEQIYENGSNLSQGQRQLLCIGRALLRNAKCLIIDEGTSAVDPFTDALIQQVLRDCTIRCGTTIFAIAHRLQTILDFDRVLVLNEGNILEFDSPQILLQRDDSVFKAMIHQGSHH